MFDAGACLYNAQCASYGDTIVPPVVTYRICAQMKMRVYTNMGIHFLGLLVDIHNYCFKQC